MGPMNSIVSFIKCKFMMTRIKFTLVDGSELSGKVVEAFDSLIGIDVGKRVIFINSNQIVTFTKED
ncbi:hypothetical protein [Acetivibrio cellulolyticus]|uniref:hypothetical protein n=1 Tax=Acetivibrio cellulolyticus TaxID=35830 RepID=UPI0001E2E7E4|nr:hypothetical protein [Acetivibrio cellulolyticus]